MKKLLLLWVIFSVIINIFAQENGNDLQTIATLRSNGRIALVKSEYQIPADQFFEKYHTYFGLGTAGEMVLKAVEPLHNGSQAFRYQQYYHGIPIEGATIILHEKNGLVTYLNGQYVKQFAKPFTPIFGADEAIDLALAQSPASQYAWQVEDLENDLKETMKDASATYAPRASLVYYDAQHSTDARQYRLAYEIHIFAINPFFINTFYIDATTGDILKVLKKNQNVNVEVQAETRYNGVKTITVDSVSAASYVLRENSRGIGNGIYTRNLNHEGSLYELETSGATDIVESDNYFDSDRVANSAHYGAEKTYDYYYDKFGRNSIDNNGLRLMSYVHLGTGVENACWDGTAMFYGDGTNGREFTCLNICGHEITHGLTTYTADLIYEDEPGALNEAFSDMFGQAIAYYATDTLRWTLGDELGQVFRDMSNPKSKQNPDTYHGQYWENPNTSEDAGVHTNSGVANYWFYLLCEGGEGLNDNGTAYHVDGIGIDKAERIAFYTLTENLVETSGYADTRDLSLMVGADLYGDCSDEVFNVAAAWNAVGVGYRYSDTAIYIANVLSPATGCSLGDNEPVVLEIAFNACDGALQAGTAIVVRVNCDAGDSILDTIVLTEPLPAGVLLPITLNATVDASTLGQHHLDIAVKTDFASDFSDSLSNYTFQNLVYQNSDIHVVGIPSPVSSCFLTDQTPIEVSFTFDICDSIAAGDSIRLGYKLNSGDTIVEWLVLDRTITSYDTITYTFNQTADFTTTAKNSLRLIAMQPGDNDNSDNTLSRQIVRPKRLNEVSRLTFDSTNMSQFYYTEIGANATLSIGNLSGYDGGKVVNMSAGNILEYYSELEIPESVEYWWQYNKSLDSRITFCADATDYAQFAIQFDLKQTSGCDMYQQLLGEALPAEFDFRKSSSMRVWLDDELVTDDFIPSTGSSDPFTTHAINLSEHTGALHSVTFESKCVAGDLLTFQLDHVYLDNIAILQSDGIHTYRPNAPSCFVYPNPTSQNVTLQISGLEQNAVYQIYDLSGKLLFTKNIEGEYTDIHLGALANGIYILKIVSGNELVGTSKIIKN